MATKERFAQGMTLQQYLDQMSMNRGRFARALDAVTVQPTDEHIQHQLGHHSATFTLRVYGHPMPRQGRRGVDGLDDASIRNPHATTHPVASLS